MTHSALKAGTLADLAKKIDKAESDGWSRVGSPLVHVIDRDADHRGPLARREPVVVYEILVSK